MKVELRHHWTQNGKPRLPGETVSVDDDTAASLVSGGLAVFPSKEAAEKAGQPEALTTRTKVE